METITHHIHVTCAVNTCRSGGQGSYAARREKTNTYCLHSTDNIEKTLYAPPPPTLCHVCKLVLAICLALHELVVTLSFYLSHAHTHTHTLCCCCSVCSLGSTTNKRWGHFHNISFSPALIWFELNAAPSQSCSWSAGAQLLIDQTRSLTLWSFKIFCLRQGTPHPIPRLCTHTHTHKHTNTNTPLAFTTKQTSQIFIFWHFF